MNSENSESPENKINQESSENQENKNNQENSKNTNKTQEKTSSFSIIAKTVNIITWIIVVIALAILLFTVASNKTEVFGYRLYIIMSGSMEPTINVKDAILTKQENEPKEGDIIAFENGNSITVHRIIKVYTEGEKRLYQTKGDNNNVEDKGLVQKSQIKGTVKVIMPVVGQAVYFLQTHFIVLILAIGIIVIIILVRRLL